MLINGHNVKGSISFDTSKKGDGIRSIKRHAAWRAVVVYEGKRFRKRSIDREDCERFFDGTGGYLCRERAPTKA